MENNRVDADPTLIARYGVAGYPVAHSRSPQVHMAAYAELGIAAEYQRLPIPAELFEETVRALPGSGFAGINVTIPHKEAALRVADDASESARSIGAANTLTFDGKSIRADNTDAPALICELNEITAIDGVNVLVLGAGGTARAAAWSLRDAGADVAVWNRTVERGRQLASDLGVSSVTSSGGGADYDVLVNTAAVGMDASESEESVLESLGLRLDELPPTTVVVHFVYRGDGSPLRNAAHRLGMPTVDGRDLLARQAALSFEIWFKRPAPLPIMRAALDS
ncbi:MAG: shikimate dehydrogenase family protein [Solirubrobacterales bacterium]